MADVVAWAVLLAVLGTVTVVCVAAARRLARPRSDDEAGSRAAQRRAVTRRDLYKGQGGSPF